MLKEHIEGKKTLDDADEFEVDYTPPRGHPPTQPPPLKGNSYGEDELGAKDSLTMTHPPENYSENEDEFGVDYSPPTTHPPKSPPTYNSDNEDEFGVDYSPPTTHPPKSPPTNA
ncbi:hypothetical protein M0R45_007814 [Rubus argutus]|uniref:Uncharacterized protein n=1 Tax=Rubus argutus TaxID=59490 RepID=A0AAW1Y094_RUBAR